jgi:hypothetical protein
MTGFNPSPKPPSHPDTPRARSRTHTWASGLTTPTDPPPPPRSSSPPQINERSRSAPLSGPRVHVTDVTPSSSPPPFSRPRVSEGGDGRETGGAGGARGAGGVRNDYADQVQLITDNLEHAPFINRRVRGGGGSEIGFGEGTESEIERVC